ncbi:hypothetical protein PGT21_007469 [Puccinia graminis f. sp. tritici]|uniref:Retrotransposon gag domain-containing protein n=1 Tax=Puccinia graminis f. sp. tritici TaxID=56615 RepID=A0A5B0MW59_PUCGR|nr:hypothetical protein PGT21_007469 [Puccinia graminis f. sp. tritici]KAA1131404.1 hypothetical protein PGTUg99_003381 [Puccinia graminis f. sp. tritici]
MSSSSSPEYSARMTFPGTPSQNPPTLSPHPAVTAPNSPILPPVSPILPPGSPMPEFNPQPGPSVQDEDDGSSARRRLFPEDPSFVNLIADLGIHNPTLEQTVYSLIQRLTNLESQSRRDKETLRSVKDLLPMSSDIMKIKLSAQQESNQAPAEFLQIRNAVDSINSSTNSRLVGLESFASRPPVVAKSFHEPPYQSHIFFSGGLSETKPFCFSVRGTLERNKDNFANEKHKVMWIAGYFRKADGRLGDTCPSFVWWQGLMKKDAVEQGLDPKTASSQPDFVLQELVTAENFIVAIEAVFSNHKEEEDIRKLLKSARQGNTSIEEFNLYFNSLLYSVDLSESSKCEFYDDAINPKIVQLGMLRGGWTTLTSLDAKQEMAVTLATDVAGLGFIDKVNQNKSQSTSQRPVQRVEHKVIVPPPKLSEAVPMDLDVLAAQIGFTYEDWKKECILQHLCHRCGGTWDSAHDTVHHCPLAKKHHLSKSQCLAIWKDWGGHVWKEGGSRSSELERPDESKWAPVNLQLGSSRGATSRQPDRQPTSPLPTDRFDKGKKRESVSEINQEPMSKKRAGKMKAPGGDGDGRSVTVDAMEADLMSVGDMCFACQLAEMEYSE